MRGGALGVSAVAALLAASRPAGAGVISPPVPTPTVASVGASMHWVPVCGRGRPIGSGNWDSTDTAVFDVTACTTPAGLAVRALKLSYMGSDLGNDGETDRMVSFTGDAAVSVPSVMFSAVVNAAVASGASSIPVQIAQGSVGNGLSVGMGVSGTNIPAGSWIASVTQTVTSNNLVGYAFTFVNGAGAVATTAALPAGEILTITGRNHVATWGDQRSVTIFPARRFFESDPIGLSLGGNTSFLVRGSWTSSGTGFWLGDYPSTASGSTRLAGEGSQRSGSSLGDHAMDQYVASNSGGGYFTPWTVLGQTPTPSPSVLLLGDSICAGTGDAADAYGHMGYMERSLGQAVPWASLCRGSTSAQQMSVNLQLPEQAAASIGATDILLEYGRNDLNASGNPQSAASTEAYLKTIAAPLIAAGYRVWVFTVSPTTDSDDGWTTSAGQFLQQQASATTAATAAGTSGAAVTVSLASTAGIQVGELAGVQNTASTVIPAGTTVTSVPSSTTLTITPTTAAAIGAIPSGTTLGFGTQVITSAGTPIEYQREQFNSWCRSAAIAAGFAGCIDDDAALEDPLHTGLWRTDLGAASAEGIHPSPALHAAVVSAGVINPAMFPAR